MHVDRSEPVQHTHGDPIGTGQVVFHLFDQVVVGVKTQVVVEAFLVVSVAAFYLAVVPRCPCTQDMWWCRGQSVSESVAEPEAISLVV